MSRRTPEIGIRMALGAESKSVVLLVLREGLAVVGVGVVVGGIAALAAGHAVASLLFGISYLDAWSFARVALLMASVALVASYFPARRATKIDPTVALRSE